jgi:hypothetical protein
MTVPSVLESLIVEASLSAARAPGSAVSASMLSITAAVRITVPSLFALLIFLSRQKTGRRNEYAKKYAQLRAYCTAFTI